MYMILLFGAWFMLRFAHIQYTISRPTGLFYSDIGDYITAFMYQPLLNILLVSFVITSLLIIYSSLYFIIHKIIRQMAYQRVIIALQFALSIYLAIIGYVYFQRISLVFILVTLYFIVQDFIKHRRKRIRRFYF